MGLLPTLAPLERVDTVGINTARPAPVWNRSARQGVVVAAWLALNPVLFPPPRDDSAFATRAVLGEERWLEQRPVSGALAINCMADRGPSHRHRQRTSSSSLADDHRNDRHMSALLWYWREMVRFYKNG